MSAPDCFTESDASNCGRHVTKLLLYCLIYLAFND